MPVLNMITFLWVLGWALLATRRVVEGRFQSILVVILVYFVFVGMPLLLDVVVKVPSFERFPGLSLAANDNLTATVYCAYVAAVPPFWWFVGRAGRRPRPRVSRAPNTSAKLTPGPLIRAMLRCGLVSPVVALLFAPNPAVYSTYAAVLSQLSTEEMEYQQVMALASSLSVLSVFGLLLSSRHLDWRRFLTLAPWLGLALWLNGKRYLIAVACALLIYVAWRKAGWRGARLLSASVAAAAFLVTMSALYQGQLRGFAGLSTSDWYENVRVDFGRDGVIKMAIFSELYPHRLTILEHRAQSLLFHLGTYVPRNMWSEKPLPYAQYVTAAALMTSPRMFGWALTTSWLEEAIANFGWVGMFIGPLVLVVMCRLGDGTQSAAVGMLTVLVTSLMLVLQLTAFAPVFGLWAASVVWSRRQLRRRVCRTIICRNGKTELLRHMSGSPANPEGGGERPGREVPFGLGGRFRPS